MFFDAELDRARNEAFQALRVPRFSVTRFVVSLADHLFFPISLLWILPRHGRGSAVMLRNTMMLPLPGQPSDSMAYAASAFGQSLLMLAAHGFLFFAARRQHHHHLQLVGDASSKLKT